MAVGVFFVFWSRVLKASDLGRFCSERNQGSVLKASAFLFCLSTVCSATTHIEVLSRRVSRRRNDLTS